MKLMPASRAAPQIWAAVASSESPPNDIARCATPSPRFCRGSASSACKGGFDAMEDLLLRRRNLADAEEATRRGRDHLREPDDLVLEQLVLLVVELAGERLDIGLPGLDQAAVGALLEPGLEQLVAVAALLEPLAVRTLEDRAAL